MKINKQRHKLLDILSKQYSRFELDKAEIAGLSNEEILSKIKCTKEDLRLIASRLFDEQEILFYKPHDKEGLRVTEKGYSSYSTRKYKFENEKLIFERLKNWVQIIVPVLSLIITLTIYLMSESQLAKMREELKKTKEKLELIEKKTVQKQSENLNNKEIFKTDTLNEN